MMDTTTWPPSAWVSREAAEIAATAFELGDEEAKRAFFNTENYIDAIKSGQITEIYGEAASGKTQLLMTFVVHKMKEAVRGNRENCYAYVISTEGLWPVERLQEIALNCLKHDGNEISAEAETIELLKRVFIEVVQEKKHLFQIIYNKLPKLLETSKVSVLVVDSIAAPLRVQSGINYSMFNTRKNLELCRLSSYLRRLAQQHDIFVLISNQMTYDNELGSPKPALGNAWNGCVDARFQIEKSKNNWTNIC